MTRIKVCGITTERDALEAVYLGADALGFVFDPGSPRFISPRTAAEISRRLPPFVARIGVFVDQDPQVIVETVDIARLTGAQLNGAEPPEVCRRLPVSWYKAFRVHRGFRVEQLARFECNTFLIEAREEGMHGADHEERAGWNLARAGGRYGRVILSGGLDPTNVEEAVRHVRPYAVEAVEGTEFEPGVKDIEKLERFVAAVRKADADLAGEGTAP